MIGKVRDEEGVAEKLLNERWETQGKGKEKENHCDIRTKDRCLAKQDLDLNLDQTLSRISQRRG